MKTPAPGFPVDALTVMLSLKCNLACSYCLRHDPEEELSDDLARRAVDLLFARGDGPKDLTFSGGEPLLRLDRLLELSALARRRAKAQGIRLRLNVLTNAAALTAAALDFLAAEDVRVVVTLSGEPAAARRSGRARTPGSWRRLEDNIGPWSPARRLLATVPVHPELAHRLRRFPLLGLARRQAFQPLRRLRRRGQPDGGAFRAQRRCWRADSARPPALVVQGLGCRSLTGRRPSAITATATRAAPTARCPSGSPPGRTASCP